MTLEEFFIYQTFICRRQTTDSRTEAKEFLLSYWSGANNNPVSKYFLNQHKYHLPSYPNFLVTQIKLSNKLYEVHKKAW